MKYASNALTALVLAVLPLSTLSAQPQPASPILQRLDNNGDGAVSREEIVAARARLFSRLDANGDGEIDEDETEWLRDSIIDRATQMQARLGNQMRRLDTNGDRKVSQEEFRARTLLFDLADRDGDGTLSATEYLAIRGVLLSR